MIFLGLILTPGIIWVFLEALGMYFDYPRPLEISRYPVVGNGGGLMVWWDFKRRDKTSRLSPPWDRLDYQPRAISGNEPFSGRHAGPRSSLALGN